MSSGDRVRRVMNKGIPPKVYEDRLYIEDTSNNLYTYEEFKSKGINKSKVKGLTAVYKDGSKIKALCLLKENYSGNMINSGMNSMDVYLDIEEAAAQWNAYWNVSWKFQTGKLKCPYLKNFLLNMTYGSYSSDILNKCNDSKWLPTTYEFDVFILSSRNEYNLYGNKILTIWDNIGMLPNTGVYDTTWYPTCEIVYSSEDISPEPEITGYTLEKITQFSYENDQYANRMSECSGWFKLITRSRINTYNWDEILRD